MLEIIRKKSAGKYTNKVGYVFGKKKDMRDEDVFLLRKVESNIVLV